MEMHSRRQTEHYTLSSKKLLIIMRCTKANEGERNEELYIFTSR